MSALVLGHLPNLDIGSCVSLHCEGVFFSSLLILFMILYHLLAALPFQLFLYYTMDLKQFPFVPFASLNDLAPVVLLFLHHFLILRQIILNPFIPLP